MNSLNVVLGRYDDPKEQKQDDYFVDLYKNNIAIFGSSMCGKTTLLKTLLFNLHRSCGLTDKEEIYILDFSDGLKKCKDLPYVAGYFDASNEENVRRAFKILNEKLKYNIRELPGTSYFDADVNKRPTHVTFVLDGFSNFVSNDAFAMYQDSLKKIARDGLSKGITVVIAGSEISGFSKVSSYFRSVIALELLKDCYSELFSKKVEKPLNHKGRGVVNSQSDQVYEFQAFLPWDFSLEDTTEENQVKILRREICFDGLDYSSALLTDPREDEEVLQLVLRKSANKRVMNEKAHIHKAYMLRKVKTIPNEKLTVDNWNEYSDYTLGAFDGEFVAGLDYYSLEPVPSVRPQPTALKDVQSIAIYGKKEFGKSNLLKLLLEATKNIPNIRYCFWDDGRCALEKSEGLWQLIQSFENRKIVKNQTDFVACMREMVSGRTVSSVPAPDRAEPIQDDCGNRILAEIDKAVKESSELEELQSSGSISREDFERRREELKEKIEQYGEAYEEWKLSLLNNRGADLKKNTDLENQQKIPNEYLNVFVIQSKLFYQCDRYESDHLISEIAHLIKEFAGEVLFIFSDVQHINNHSLSIDFNNCLRYAFLLDDIVRFVNGTKGRNSVFESQDITELKESFGMCEPGDGFFYDVERDTISKLRFIYSNPNNE